MKKKVSLIIGNGEIGSSLKKVLEKNYKVYVQDIDLIPEMCPNEKVDVMHVCIPPIPQFERVVKDYIKQYNPKYTIVHSTVKMGTCKRLGVYHSPVRGIHPYLTEGIQTFVKFLAPKSFYLKRYFSKVGVKTRLVKDTNTTEALKFWCTTYYGWNIIFEKLLYKWCKENDVDYDIIYKETNITYNEGYVKLGMPYVVRPVLKHFEGQTGGHCVTNNMALFNSPIKDFFLKYDKTFKMSKLQKGSRKDK